MRVPGRVHISWADENTLKIETDAGEQTRLFHFIGASLTGKRSARRTWQGYSVANWERPVRGSGTPWLRPGRDAGRHSRRIARSESPRIARRVSSQKRAALQREYRGQGILRPAQRTQRRHWFTVTTIVDDPTYLTSRSSPAPISRRSPMAPDGAPPLRAQCHLKFGDEMLIPQPGMPGE